ncbi:MAG: hypothetical protein IKD28_02900, partial [Clostridia bacterium]|nr:hypothetical protein [Clostridia bacterium]
MDKRTKNNEITLAILWKTVRERWLFLLLALIIGATAGFVYSKFVATPVYSSSAEFVVVIKETANSNSSAVSSSYQQGTVQVAATYTKIIGGNVFNKEVASLYSANKTTQLTTRALQSMVKVENEEEGSSFTVKVSSTNPKQAIELLRIYEALT